MSDQDKPNDDSKLTRAKERWAAEGKFLTGHTARPETERLPPGQHLVKNWPILDIKGPPRVSMANWSLEIEGLVETPFTWNWEAFLSQPQSTKLSDIHCVTSWSRYDNTWEGVATRDLMAMAGVKDEARHVILTSNDGYTTNMAIEDFASDHAIIAHSWQGEPLPLDHGGPVRLVVPHLYFWKSAKWLRKIEFVPRDQKGFWEVRGYHNHADPWLEERYS
jgi:DMSO/TMAO reductase YedYZ molybdopterin-dependent catalytic subunit